MRPSAGPARLELPPNHHVYCASCGDRFDLEPYGAAMFCRECREQADPFVGKELYCDLGGGD